ncbi:MAG TPA: nitrate reductase associated protein [Fibrobacteria bacterium]|nr:nitrate reductase associated protein [Fibrobacteria bacterium]
MSRDAGPASLPGGSAGDAAFFGFESDFVDSLRCIPMAVRLRLDVSGVKLKLNEWSKLGQAERLRLVQAPFASAESVRAYAEDLSALVEKVCGARPSMLAELPDPVWENAGTVPAQVVAQAHAVGLDLPPAAWASLSPLQRFALTKLSRAGHENRNFVPAMQEFGLA